MTTLHLFHLSWSTRLTAFFTSAGKWLCSFLIGTIWTLIAPVVPMLGVCIFAMVADTISAWRLNRRCRVKYPQYTDGKLHSNKIFLLFHDFLILFFTILLAHWIDTIVLPNIDTLYLPNWIAAIYCCYQIISIIENESSCSDSSWAKLAQKVVANKIARHLDLDADQVEELLHPQGSARPNLDGHPHPDGAHAPSSASHGASEFCSEDKAATTPSASPASPSAQ